MPPQTIAAAGAAVFYAVKRWRAFPPGAALPARFLRGRCWRHASCAALAAKRESKIVLLYLPGTVLVPCRPAAALPAAFPAAPDTVRSPAALYVYHTFLNIFTISLPCGGGADTIP